MNAALALQTAVLARLRVDAGLAASVLAGRIFDAPPRDAAFPHLVVADALGRDRSGLDAVLLEQRLALRIRSRRGGRHEVLTLAGLVETALDGAALALGGWRLVLLRREATEVRLLDDAVTAEALLRLVALLEPL